jgi:glutathione synthase/RimK-type ligase-like ATP-grasp enzyme
VVDVDATATAQALTRAGVAHELVPWDAARDWSAFDAVVVRSTWDYTTQVAEFLEVLSGIEEVTPVWNPVPVLRWNVDKRYLADLEAQGVAVVPTLYVAPDESPDLAIVTMPLPLVVKPVVSAGAKNTARHDTTASATHHAHSLLAAGHTVMVQPYLQRVNSEGETGLVYLQGAFSHAFTKASILAGADGQPWTTSDGLVVERITPRDATPEQLAVGDQVVQYVQRRFSTLLYARVDLLPSDEGPVVLEVELVEPNLFLSISPGAADRFAHILRGRLSVA